MSFCFALKTIASIFASYQGIGSAAIKAPVGRRQGKGGHLLMENALLSFHLGSDEEGHERKEKSYYNSHRCNP